jgi:murein DD-endopeptidase MepM/ murein hydrolase activator NlpD
MTKIYWPIPSVKKKIPESKSRCGFGRNKVNNRFHAGTDILAKYGSDVVAIESGVVRNIFLFTFPGLDKYEKYANTYAIAIKHKDGNYALYAEIQKPKINIGQKVKAGQKIAKVGRVILNSNRTMLHFEYHSKLPIKTTKWYKNKRPKNLLSSTIYLKKLFNRINN